VARSDGAWDLDRGAGHASGGGGGGDVDDDDDGGEGEEDEDDDEGSVGSLVDFVVLSDSEQEHARLGEETDCSFVPSDDDEEDEEDDNSDSHGSGDSDSTGRSSHGKSRIVDESDSDLPSEVVRRLKRHRKDKHRTKHGDSDRAVSRSRCKDDDNDDDDMDDIYGEQSRLCRRRRRLVCGARRRHDKRKGVHCEKAARDKERARVTGLSAAAADFELL